MFIGAADRAPWHADATELAGLPEHCEEVLECPLGAPARCVAFNPAGTMVATGCVGGNILIWDYQTRGLIRTWSGGHRCVLCVRTWCWYWRAWEGRRGAREGRVRTRTRMRRGL